MRNVEIKRTVTLTMTADDWELYDTPNRDDVARDLNLRIASAINKAKSADEASSLSEKILRQWSDAGAYDSEPMYHLERIMSLAFPDTRHAD